VIAALEAFRAGLYRRDTLLANVIAGAIVGIVALPLAMAFAIAAGVRPENGIYTAIVAGLIVSLFGGSRVQIAGPTGAFIVILAGITARYGVGGLQIATLMAGAMLLAFGIARLGGVIRFIPMPVIAGFTAGIGVIIFVGEWKDFFGLPAVSGTQFSERLWHLVLALPQLHPATTAIALLSLAILLFAPKIKAIARIPAPLVALVIATLVQAIFRFPGVATLGTAFGGIPQVLPAFALPSLPPGELVELIGPAFTIALLGAIESLLSAVVADGMTGHKHNSNQELIGQGLANIVVPFFGGIAATGAIARTATNIRNGATNPIAGIVHAATLVLVVLVLAPLAASVPLAVLAAILFVVAYNMSDVKHFAYIVRSAPRADVAILLITFGLTIFTSVVIAVNAGIILAALQFLRRMSAAVTVEQVPTEDMSEELARSGITALPLGVLVYGIEGPFFFAAVETFERALINTRTDPKILIIRLLHVPFIDITGLKTIIEVIEKLEKRSVRVMLCEANARVYGKLVRAGVLTLLQPDDYADDFATIVARCAPPQTVDTNPTKAA